MIIRLTVHPSKGCLQLLKLQASQKLKRQVELLKVQGLRCCISPYSIEIESKLAWSKHKRSNNLRIIMDTLKWLSKDTCGIMINQKWKQVQELKLSKLRNDNQQPLNSRLRIIKKQKQEVLKILEVTIVAKMINQFQRRYNHNQILRKENRFQENNN